MEQLQAALSQLDDLSEVPVSEHVELFSEAHRQLQEALATLDEV
ncbi:MAG TPA: hypothetical protein VNA30_03560 [Mycobacteriales bacterium]|nr:hypothetical protein [Mycobacteriales bacterium]